MSYVVALLALFAFFILTVFCMRFMKRVWLWNLIFAASVFALYLSVSLKIYFDVGFDDWNFRNTLPVANVSPFMFTLTPLTLLFPRKIKKHLYLLISLLSVGMLASALLGCVYNAVIGYKFHLHFLCDYAAHVMLSLWGVYLLRTRQVDFGVIESVRSSLIIIGAALLMLIMNLIFDTSFFGLSLSGKHSIYNMVLTENSYLSAVLYFLGLFLVLLLGFLFSKLLSKHRVEIFSVNKDKFD